MSEKVREIEDIYKILNDIKDPEMPFISIVDLGMIRKLYYEDNILNIIYTLTYTACSAKTYILKEIERTLKLNGIKKIHLTEQIYPSWTTDWISEIGIRNIVAQGIATPKKECSSCAASRVIQGNTYRCPLCGSENSTLKSRYSGTVCKSLYICNDCSNPFDAVRRK